MTIRKFTQIAVIAASLTLAGAAHAAKGNKAGGRAAGKVSKIDATAKTFVVTNKKKGDTTVTFDDKTAFKKAAAGEETTPTDAKVTDLKDGGRVLVSGKMESGKLVASTVTLGGRKKKAAK